MELIYFWINSSDYGTFNNQDVKLSNEYEIEFNIKDRILNIEKNNNYFNIFKSDVIENVNVIIGSNGAGKTTLLKYIYERNAEAYKIFDGESINDDDIIHFDNRVTIQVFKENAKLLVIHNIKNGIEINSIESYNVFNTYEDNDVEDISPMTKIYLTNSSYNNEIDGYSIEKGRVIADIALTTQSIKIFANNFYSNLVKFPNGLIKDNWFNGLQQIVISQEKEENFQQICDLKYFNKLYKYGHIESFSGKVSTEIVIGIKSLYKILENVEDNMQIIKRYNSNLKYSNRIKSKLKKWRKIFSDEALTGYLMHNCPMSRVLEINLVFELDFIYNILDNYKPIDNKDILSYCYNKLEKIKELEDLEKKYYLNAINEIMNLKEILKESNECQDIFLDYNEVKEEYLNFCKYIDQILEKNESFILKYININNLGMSSGERAYLNFFSWLNLLKFFEKISNNNILVNTKDTILLLVDEMDLYCHPEWQRKMVKNMLDELKIQFVDKKIQVIFTTHSPIVLSDIPLTNTLYIKSEKGKTNIDSRELHNQTFGANIYNLYKDAFFFKREKEKDIGIIGGFALDKLIELENKLDEWLRILENIQKERIKDNLHIDDIEVYNNEYFWKEITRQYGEKYNKTNINIFLECSKKIINLIGEEIIKDMIKKKYDSILRELYKMRYNNNDSLELMDSKIKYDKLSNKDRENLIKYIIEQNNEV